MNIRNVLALASLLPSVATAYSTGKATCNLQNSLNAPVLASGWESKLVATKLTKPRGILFDSSGNLLVIQQGAGLIHLAFVDGGSTCLDVEKKTFLVNSTDVGNTTFGVYLQPLT